MMFEEESTQTHAALDFNALDTNAAPELDWAFIKTMFDLTPLVLPMSRRRVMTWCIYLGLASGLYFLDKETNFSQTLMEGLQKQINILTLLTYGLEPAILLFYMILAKYPYFEPEHTPEALPNDVPKNQDTVLIIPCHLSASSLSDIKSLQRILHAGLKHFPASHIFIIDNGAAEKAPDPTYRVVKEIHPNIHYKYYANPNKTTALYVGLKMAQHMHGDKINYGLFIDDDVEIPKNFELKRHFFNDPTVRGIIYPIRATSATGRDSLLIHWQDIEYHISDIALAAADVSQSAVAPHGACMVLEINTAEKIFERHTGLFKGEDKEVGERLRHMYDTAGALKFRVDMACHFKTNVPESYLGTGGNLWGQRVRSWSEAPFLYFWRLTLKPVLLDWPTTPLALMVTKVDQSYHLISQCSHVFRYALIASQARRAEFWTIYSALLMVQLAAVMFFNYHKLPPYLRNDLTSVLTFPIYKQIDGFLAHMAFWRVLLVSFPQETAHPPIKALLEAGLIPSIAFDDPNTHDDASALEEAFGLNSYSSWYSALADDSKQGFAMPLDELQINEPEEQRAVYLRQLRLFGFNHKKNSPNQKVSSFSPVPKIERQATV